MFLSQIDVQVSCRLSIGMTKLSKTNDQKKPDTPVLKPDFSQITQNKHLSKSFPLIPVNKSDIFPVTIVVTPSGIYFFLEFS